MSEEETDCWSRDDFYSDSDAEYDEVDNSYLDEFFPKVIKKKYWWLPRNPFAKLEERRRVRVLKDGVENKDFTYRLSEAQKELVREIFKGNRRIFTEKFIQIPDLRAMYASFKSADFYGTGSSLTKTFF